MGTWDAATLARLAEQTGGPTPIHLFGPDLPPAILDFSGFDNLAVIGRAGNPLQKAADAVDELRLLRARVARWEARAALVPPRDEPDDDEDDAPDFPGEDPDAEEAEEEPTEDQKARANDQTAWLDRLRTWYDEVAATVFIEPAYQTIADIQANAKALAAYAAAAPDVDELPGFPPRAALAHLDRDGRDPSKLWLGQLTWQQRNSLTDVLYQGVDALKSFRARWEGAGAVRDGDGGGEEPERLPGAPDPAPAVLARRRPVSAKPGAVAPGTAPRRRARAS